MLQSFPMLINMASSDRTLVGLYEIHNIHIVFGFEKDPVFGRQPSSETYQCFSSCDR